MSQRLTPSILITVTLCAIFVSEVFAVHPPESSAIEVGIAEPEASVVGSGGRMSLETGLPLAIYDVGFKVRPGLPEDQARQYLRASAAKLGFRNTDLADLHHHTSRTVMSGTTVRFRQRAGGLPVWGAEVTVTINNRNEVVFVANTYEESVAVHSVDPTLTADEARAEAARHIGLGGSTSFESNTLMIFQNADLSRLVYRVVITPLAAPRGEWEVLVDAHDGGIVRASDVAFYATVDGTGNVFEPDPLSSALVTYGTPGFEDGNDADTPQLTGETFSRVLRDITESGGTYSLEGPYADVTDWDSPYKGNFSQDSDTFAVSRQSDAFEAVNGYYHIDTFMRYINEELGVTLHPYQYGGGVQFDPHGWGGADNSSYSSNTGRLTFGEGGVDDAEDADVLIHELGHGIHDWVTSGGLSQVTGLSEGCGDYLAVSYSRSYEQWTPADPQYNWVFSWDGHNPFWPGRNTAWVDSHPWPTGLVGQIHTDGQIWAGCMLRVWDAVGREQSDRAFLVGLGMTNSGSNQNDAAHAVLQASVDLGYPEDDVVAIATALASCGYTVEVPGPMFDDGFESGDTSEWSTTNP